MHIQLWRTEIHSSQFKKHKALLRNTIEKHNYILEQENRGTGPQRAWQIWTAKPKARVILSVPDRDLKSLISVTALISPLSSEMSFLCRLVRIHMAKNGFPRLAPSLIPTWPLCLCFQAPNIIWLQILYLLTWILERRHPVVLDQSMDWFPLSQISTFSTIKYG